MLVITVARKPIDASVGTVAANALKWGTGGLNIDGTRIDIPEDDRKAYDFNMKGLNRYSDGRDNIGAYGGGWRANP